MNAASLGQSERAFQGAVIQYARVQGWLVAHHHDSRRQIRPGVHVGDHDAAGLPDLIMARGGHLIFAELKAAGGRLSAAQRDWLNALAEIASADVEAFLWRPEDWPEIEAVLA